jgi:hypothetical protein
MLHTTLIRLAYSLAACVVCTAAAQGIELVSNGGFESGDFTGWTVEGPQSNLFQVDDFHGHTGAYSLLFAALESDNTRVSQVTPTALGQQYILDFWVWNTSDGNSGVGGDGLSIYWEGAPALDLQPVSAQVNTWLNYSLNVTATANGSELEFHGFDAPFVIYLDDVSLVAVPEPSAVLLLAMSAGSLFMRPRR